MMADYAAPVLVTEDEFKGITEEAQAWVNKGKYKRKAEAAIGLMALGLTWSRVATMLDYKNAQAARNAAMRELAAQGDEETRKDLRNKFSAMLEGLSSLSLSKAHDSRLSDQRAWVMTAAYIIKQHSDLVGAGAPSEHVVYTPAAAEIERILSEMTQNTMGALPQEADIIDGIVVQ